VTRTDDDGSYVLQLTGEEAPFVFVVWNDQWRPRGEFYRPLTADAESRTVDFAMVKHAPAGAAFRFIVISDTHCNHPKHFKQLSARYAQLNELKPAFIAVTGDLTNHQVNKKYNVKRYAEWRKAKAGSTCPVIDVPGNHDTATPAGLAEYRESLGPTHHAFDFGDRHFVIFDSNRPNWRWVNADLDATPRDRKVIVFSHHGYSNRGKYMHGGLKKNWTRCEVLFFGHGHVHKSGVYKNLPYHMSGTIHQSFHLVDVAPAKLTVTWQPWENATWGQIKARFLSGKPATRPQAGVPD